MAKTKSNKEAEVLEAPVPTSEKSSEAKSNIDFDSFFDKNKKLIVVVAGVIALAVTGYAGYTYFAGNQNDEAQKEMFIAVNYFEKDSFDLALNGDKVNRGFIDIADEYSLSKAGNLSNYYIGVIYLKKGKFEDAIEYLKKFKGNDLLVQARAYSLIGDAYLEQNDIDNAVSYYKKASEYEPNEYFTPRYLMKLAVAYEVNKDYTNAGKAYSTIIDNYAKSSEYNDARKYKARAEELAKGE
jgi:tetratricopeptide (TPR) repeat protein